MGVYVSVGVKQGALQENAPVFLLSLYGYSRPTKHSFNRGGAGSSPQPAACVCVPALSLFFSWALYSTPPVHEACRHPRSLSSPCCCTSRPPNFLIIYKKRSFLLCVCVFLLLPVRCRPAGRRSIVRGPRGRRVGGKLRPSGRTRGQGEGGGCCRLQPKGGGGKKTWGRSVHGDKAKGIGCGKTGLIKRF